MAFVSLSSFSQSDSPGFHCPYRHKPRDMLVLRAAARMTHMDRDFATRCALRANSECNVCAGALAHALPPHLRTIQVLQVQSKVLCAPASALAGRARGRWLHARRAVTLGCVVAREVAWIGLGQAGAWSIAEREAANSEDDPD